MQAQFEMWSTFHYFMIIFPFVLAVILYIVTRDKTFAVKRRVAIAMGMTIDVSIQAEVRETSFVLFYSIKGEGGEVVATLQTVHVAVDRKTGEKVTLPEEIRQGLLTIT